MKFVLSRDELSNLIGHIQNVIPPKASVPILSNFLIEAYGNELTLTATDLTVGVRCRTEAKIIENGATTLPAKRFFQLIHELTAPHIEFSCNENEISEIVAGSSHFNLKGMDKSKFPTLPDFTGAAHLSIKGEDLREAMFRTAFAVSRDDHRYILTGVLMHIEKDSITFIGTDGKRLAKIVLAIESDESLNGRYVLPIKAVDEMLKISSSENVTIYFEDNKIAIKTNKIIIVSKLLSGEYPDVNRVIPQNNDISVTLHREELISLLKQILLFTPDADHSVRFTLSNGDLKITANNATVGDAKVNMPVNYTGNLLQIAFNPGFFLDILRHSKDETVDITLTDSYNPGIISDTSDAICVIMPMRLNEE